MLTCTNIVDTPLQNYLIHPMALNLNNPTEATAWLVLNPRPNDANTLTVLAACAEADSVFDTCGLLTVQKLALIRQGVNSIAKLRLLGSDRKSVLESLKPVTALPVNRGGCEFGLDIVTNLTAAGMYFEDCRNRDLPRIAAEFTAMVLDEWVEQAIDAGSDDGDSDDVYVVKGPGKFKVDDFVSWKEGLDLKLRAMKGATRVPLYYVIRKVMPVP